MHALGSRGVRSTAFFLLLYYSLLFLDDVHSFSSVHIYDAPALINKPYYNAYQKAHAIFELETKTRALLCLSLFLSKMLYKLILLNVHVNRF